MSEGEPGLCQGVDLDHVRRWTLTILDIESGPCRAGGSGLCQGVDLDYVKGWI